MDYLDLEIHIGNLQGDIYPVEITLDNQRHFKGHIAAGSILPWIPNGDPITDGLWLFSTLFSHSNTVRITSRYRAT